MSTAPAVPQSMQELLPKWAHFCLYTEKFINHELGVNLTGKHLLVGFSGGVDSTALLLVLHYLSKRNDCRISAAHLNHSLRPEADDDAAWAESLCSSLGIECFVRKVDVQSLADKSGVGLEEAGRNARYIFFNELMEEKAVDLLALGHHQDDLSEDVLMRIIRGTGWPGLSGMPGYDAERSLIRPFLMLPKSTLKAFVSSVGIVWREDATNLEPSATRNRVRNELLPLILRENPNFLESVGRLWKIGRIEGEYWKDMTGDITGSLDNEMLATSHQAVRLRLYKACLDSLGTGQALAHTLFRLDEAWEEKRVGSTFQFPGDKIATITASGVDFSFKH